MQDIIIRKIEFPTDVILLISREKGWRSVRYWDFQDNYDLTTINTVLPQAYKQNIRGWVGWIWRILNLGLTTAGAWKLTMVAKNSPFTPF